MSDRTRFASVECRDKVDTGSFRRVFGAEVARFGGVVTLFDMGGMTGPMCASGMSSVVSVDLFRQFQFQFTSQQQIQKRSYQNWCLQWEDHRAPEMDR